MIRTSVLVVLPCPVILQRHQLVDVDLVAIDQSLVGRVEANVEAGVCSCGDAIRTWFYILGSVGMGMVLRSRSQRASESRSGSSMGPSVKSSSRLMMQI